MASVRVAPAIAIHIRERAKGAVARDMLRRGLRVESAAKRRISHSPRRIDTGRLRASINTRPIVHGGLPGVRVGTNVDYAIYVHEGTRHMQANPFLRDALPAARG